VAKELFCKLLLLRRGPVVEPWDQLALGRSNPALRPEARKLEASVLAKLLEHKPSRVLTSDLRRASVSAKRLAEELGASLAVLRDLRERDLGQFDGKRWSELVIREGELALPFLANFCEARPPAGETLAEMQKRVVKAVWAEGRRRQRQTLLYVGHAGPIRAILAHSLQLSLQDVQRFQLDPFSLSIVDVRGDNSLLRLLNAPLTGESSTLEPEG
jgi:broad specificity phosphatase PhoE